MTRLAIFFAGVVTLVASDEKKAKPQLPPAVQSVVDLARSAAPEFFADTMVRLIGNGAVPERESRIDLLEEAFAVAEESREPYRVIAIPATPQDTRALHRSKAAELQLDALSLESRIVGEMVRIDGLKARAMFEQIARPQLGPRPCEDPLVADVSAYYEAAAAIAQSAFPDAQKQKNAHIQFLEAVLDGARSPGELLSFLKAIQSVNASSEQRRLLAGALATKLASIGADFRPFAMTYEELKSQIDALSAAEREALAPALRDYAIAQASAPRCAPDFGPRIYGDGEDEVRPSKIESGIKADVYFQSGESQSIAKELERLRAAAGRDKWLQSARGGSAIEWPSLFSDFLGDFAAWRPEGEDIDAFHQRATVLRVLMEITRPGPDRDRVMRMCVDFLAAASAERDYPAEWLYQVRMLTEGPGFDAEKMRTAFRASGNPALELYAYFSGSNGTSK